MLAVKKRTTQETTMTLSQLIHISRANHETRFSAQHGIFFDGVMDSVIVCLKLAGHQVQQNDGTRVLVDHAAWVTAHGVVYPAYTSNL
jgi:hypothetical protein